MLSALRVVRVPSVVRALVVMSVLPLRSIPSEWNQSDPEASGATGAGAGPGKAAAATWPGTGSTPGSLDRRSPGRAAKAGNGGETLLLFFRQNQRHVGGQAPQTTEILGANGEGR